MMYKLGPRNSVNVNIAIHLPNPTASLKSKSLKIGAEKAEASLEYRYDTPANILDLDKIKDIVEISPNAKKYASRRCNQIQAGGAE
jgi:hypothetical protein